MYWSYDCFVLYCTCIHSFRRQPHTSNSETGVSLPSCDDYVVIRWNERNIQSINTCLHILCMYKCMHDRNKEQLCWMNNCDIYHEKENEWMKPMVNFARIFSFVHLNRCVQKRAESWITYKKLYYSYLFAIKKKAYT